jgi:hypothetical protein
MTPVMPKRLGAAWTDKHKRLSPGHGGATPIVVPTARLLQAESCVNMAPLGKARLLAEQGRDKLRLTPDPGAGQPG